MRKQYYVRNKDNKMVYEVKLKVNNYDLFSQEIQLELIAGWDYINEDSDIQGYVPADRFVEDVQAQYFTFYPLDETIKERLEFEDYEFVELKDLHLESIVSAL